MTDKTIPTSQCAVQLTGPDTLALNKSKPLAHPGPTEILAKIEAVGLCFSDLKLLKQFDKHVRKGPIVSGFDGNVDELAGYMPGELPGVPGHEAVARIVAVGEDVEEHEVGQRVLVQADWRELRTAQSNGAFGYNFEGGLQEYALLDERVVIEPSTGQHYLLPAGEECSSSAVALVEPWACVEDSYVTQERQGILDGGKLLVVADAGPHVDTLDNCIDADHRPEETTIIYVGTPGDEFVIEDDGGVFHTEDPIATIESLPDGTYDDIVYFGSDPDVAEALNGKLGTKGILNLVLCGGSFGRKVRVDVGRVHYGMQRWCGTTGSDAAEGYANIPATGEVRDGDKVLIVGAAGPMGQMHVIRVLCAGRTGLEVVGTDMDDARLDHLGAKATRLAETNGVNLRLVNTKTAPLSGETFRYVALMAPIPALVAAAVDDAAEGALINIFAGIPAGTKQELDLDAYVAKKVWMFGTSGSTIRDMQLVLEKVQSGQLDTNVSVDAVSGMAGAIDGIRAVEARTMAGKIIVYPELKDLPLTPLDRLADVCPAAAEKLDNGQWTPEAEAALLKE